MEDAGKTFDAGRGCFVDYNRAGVPLIETVSEPCMRSADEAAACMKALYQIVTALGVCHGNMEQGNCCDANVSVRKLGEPTLGTKVELVVPQPLADAGSPTRSPGRSRS